MSVVKGARGSRSVFTLALATLGALALALGMASLSAPVAQARAGDTPVQQAVTLDSPAVVRIVSVIDARLTCASCASDHSNIVSPAPSANPFEYYSSGSGAFISPDGAILTADHVVDHSMNNPEEVQFVEQQAAQDIGPRYNTDSNTALQFLQNHPNQVSIAFTVRFQRAYLSTAYTGKLTDTKHILAFDINAVLASSPVLKQDTAIVRINTSGVTPKPDFPYLTLATAPVQDLDTVTAIAFPAAADDALNGADFTALIPPVTSDPNTVTSLLSASVNQGSVTNAGEVRADGTPVYETNGIGSQGSSGGPVINDQGQVIGFVDAGPASGSATGQLTFITPSSVVAKYAAQAGVSSPPQGEFMRLWSKALTEYYGSGTCHWTNASTDFTTLDKQYPQFAGAKSLSDQAKLKAAGETCSTGGTSGGAQGNATVGFLIIGGCLFAVLALVVAVILIVIGLLRRKPAPRPAVAAAQPYPAVAQPAPYLPATPYVAPPPQPAPYAPPAPQPASLAAPYIPPAPQPAQSAQPAPYVPSAQSVPPPVAPGGQPYVPPAGSAPWPVPGSQAQRPPVPSAKPLTPTRFCPNGHVVLEPDTEYCPMCGLPVAPVQP